MNELVDTSVIVHVTRVGHLASARLRTAIRSGRVGVIAPVRLEAARGARNPAEAVDLFRALSHDGTPEVTAPAWTRAERTLIELARLPGGRHRAVSTTDLLVASVAEEAGMTVLHRDRDFELIAAVTGQPMRWFGAGA